LFALLFDEFIKIDVILKKIGSGGFGKVFLCFNGKKSENDLCAVKCTESSSLINSGDRERQFGYMSKLNSQYLVKYYETFTLDNDYNLYVVMEYFKNGNLHDFIKQYQEKNRKIEEEVYFYFIWNVYVCKDCRRNSVIVTVRSLCTSF
jgi:serine/threonine protein kinase